MTTDLEKQFFDKFGIKGTLYRACCKDESLCIYTKNHCKTCRNYLLYRKPPHITDTQYLEMLAYLTCLDDECFDGDLNEVKTKILKDIIRWHEYELWKQATESKLYDGLIIKDVIQKIFAK